MNGFSSITEFQVYWDEGTNTDPLVYYGTASQFANFFYATTTISSGTTYKFDILSVNKYGESPLTGSPVSILAAQAPNQMNAVTSQASADSLSIVFSWVQPVIRGSSITAYQVQVYSKTLKQYVQSISLCDYSNIAVKSC